MKSDLIYLLKILEDKGFTEEEANRFIQKLASSLISMQKDLIKEIKRRYKT